MTPLARGVPEQPAASAAAAGTVHWRALDGLRYGAPGLPLAFVALPLYVFLPNHLAADHGVPLAPLGALLLGTRLLDALADPLIGRRVDAWFAESARLAWRRAALACVLLAAGFQALFFPPVRDAAPLLTWCAGALVLTYLSYSVVSVVHQAWGARLGGDVAQRSRIVAWREGCALVGVLVASVLPSLAGFALTSAAFAMLLFAALLLLAGAPAPRAGVALALPLLLALRTGAFRRLLGVFLVNGVASAVPATLVLFFMRDRLQAQAFEGLFLAAYFASGALSMPLWVRLVERIGLARSWLAGMLLAIAVFAGAATLGPGDVAAFAAVCIASGAALGADLVVPGALLTGVIRRAGHAERAEGAYLGWWNFASKLNLALAAGTALPLLGAYRVCARKPRTRRARCVDDRLLRAAVRAEVRCGGPAGRLADAPSGVRMMRRRAPWR